MRLLPAFLLSLLLACGSSEPTANAPASAAVQRQVRDLVTALTPPPATANSAVRGDWFQRRDAIMKESRTAGPALGQAVLEEFEASGDALLDVRRGLLEVAAYNLPEVVQPELTRLLLEYGEDLGLRTKACELLAVTSPAVAVEVLEPLITQRLPGKTLPPDEIMVTSYGRAASLAGVNPVPVLSNLAADLFAEQTARLMAIKELARHAGARSRETLRTVLVESTGNAYLRRAAAQGIVAHAEVDGETKLQMCAILEEVMNKEADLNFQGFLVSMLEKHCR